ncbi:MAG: hypothetical protein RL095_659 [Verrucomicrobiota bacterium]|jgi:hypothetical protein
MKFLTLTAALSLFLALNLRAEDTAPAGEGKKEGAGECKDCKKGKPSKEEILKEFDKDGDGKLNDEEKAAAKAAHKGKGKGKGEGKGKKEEAKAE